MTLPVSRNKQAGFHLSLVVMATVVTSIAFYLNPSIDMTVSQHFFDGEQFPLSIMDRCRHCGRRISGPVRS
ncbi:hypothetical protein GGE35_003669 [Rhizobium cellulosilyticum]|uniref:Transmembrane protein n=1 Tax=Aliirhizobium cellulosilyticum TaxID=393664 RepID=A0A7W6TIC4_9HYPH|nr:hypothetical protein [Rhizobium cellulosilyticum]MBB4413228.1 hypothetical protein [Rhizobium cellulosilyticum]MBB4447834.1 hypothetical protein [Rhizobium cellulosilyticum]